ncbi:MAG: DNA repair protein RecO [Candidatus Aminicenantes bacterium]|nr:DNA repair protein RecO [Candidatus Aminicenantes bacterium]MBL7082531.1 DNA repair protein RecO [Candidatus Aminicenantes bacterium]
MPLEQTEAIVLRTFNTGEQDKIVVFFSREKGILRGVAKGARKFGNRFGSSLEPLSFVKFYYYEKERKDLVTIGNCDLLESFFEIQNNLETSFTLSYFAELIEEFSPSRAKDDVLYRLLLSVMHSLKERGDLYFLTRYFETWLLKINGVLPDFNKCLKCRKALTESGWLSLKKDGVFCDQCAPKKKEKIKPEFGAFVQWIKKNPPPKKGPLPFSPEQLNTIKKVLREIIVFHLEREPKTLRYI